ncbi:MAG TPA: amidohydrolase family protein, partial [Tepidisphaeraceae bacterium]|nr:amidohydrolase family protein [Tepidisphaeraceae bacterium]
HMHRVAGLDLPTAARMASLTPATILRIEREVGSIEVGKLADFVLLDQADLRVRSVYVGGAAIPMA